MFVNQSNLDRATAAWGGDMPGWVRLLASACDASNQKVVGARLNRSGGYVSRVLSRTYAGSYSEAETLVRATFGGEDVICPIWGAAIPLSSCVRSRRRKGPPINHDQRRYARTCPTCPMNTDREEG